jgi:ribosome biogenesis GTPase
LLEQFGWSDALQKQFAPYATQGLAAARVVVQQRSLVTLATGAGERTGRLTGRLVHETAPEGLPVAGDWVAIDGGVGGGPAMIHAVLPRRTAIVRRAADSAHAVQVIAANVDVALVMMGLDGDFNLRRLERYLAAVWRSGARPVVVLTKSDVCTDIDAAVASCLHVGAGAPLLAVSAATGEGLAELSPYLRPATTVALLGSSGVGKSTLANVLAGRQAMQTGAVRLDDSHGRHTTTHRELVLLPGGALILDSPGMREFGLTDAGDAVSATFEDIEALASRCRFRDCSHEREPGCAVRVARETGELGADRWRSFDKLRREAAHFERREDPVAREAERRRWISVNKSQHARRRSDGWDR